MDLASPNTSTYNQIMTHDESMRLFKYMQAEFRKIDLRFDDVNRRIDSVSNALDTVLKQNETYTEQMSNLSHRVDRHGKIFKKLSKAVQLD